MAFRKKNRDINIFSMSALDLFASALGAFIIITVIVLPYYLKTNPDLIKQLAVAKEQLAEEQKKLSEEKEKLKQAKDKNIRTKNLLVESESENKKSKDKLKEAEKKISKLKPQDLDLVFVVDTTSSMGEPIKDLRSQLLGITRVLNKVSKSLNVGFVVYRDNVEKNLTYVTRSFNLTPMSSSGFQSLQNFVNAVEAGGKASNDWPEAVFEGLQLAKNMRWRDHAKKIIILIGDAEAKNELGALRVINEFKQLKNSTISTIYTDTFRLFEKDEAKMRAQLKPVGVAFFKKAAQLGGGEYISDRGRMLESVLLSVL